MSNLNELKPISKLSTFHKFCCTIGNLPSSYLLSLTYEEQLLWLCEYLQNTVIPALNNNADAVVELQNLYEQLKDYVDNYFENLDVQEEINNKLEEMKESGQLAEIITQYLEISGILAFNTVEDLNNASNLIDGSFVRIYGKDTYNDGKGAFYKVRTITSTDVVDEDNIVSLSNFPTLIAEKMNNFYFDELKNDVEEFKEEINTNIEEFKSELFINNKPVGMKKVIFISDSYGVANNNFIDKLVLKLGLNEDEYYKSVLGSTGFVNTNQNKKFIDLFNDVVNDLSEEEKNNISHVIVCGGANDNSYSLSAIDTKISEFVLNVNDNLQNAKIFIGEIGWTSDSEKIIDYSKVVEAYSKCNKYNNCFYLNNIHFTLHNYNYIMADGVHPTSDGHTALANNIYSCLMTGSCDIIYSQKNIYYNTGGVNRRFFETLNNNQVTIYSNRSTEYPVNIASVLADGIRSIELTEDIFDYAKGSYYETNTVNTTALMSINGTKRNIPCTIELYEGKLKLNPISITQAGAFETLTNITYIILPKFNLVMNSLNC